MKLMYCLILVAFVTTAGYLWPAPAAPQDVLPSDQAAQMIAISNVTVEEGTVSGEIVSRCSRTLHNVQLLIRHAWHWRNEFRPGEDDQGAAVYHTVNDEITPGATVPFVYRPAQSLPSRSDGYFVTTVTLAGFSETVR